MHVYNIVAVQRYTKSKEKGNLIIITNEYTNLLHFAGMQSMHLTYHLYICPKKIGKII